MVVYKDTQGFYCYHCGGGGDVFNLIQLARGCDFKGSLAWAAEHGLMSGNGHTHGQEREYYDVLTQAANWFHAQLPEETRAHLRTHYGLSDEIIDQHRIGYAPTDTAALPAALKRKFRVEEIHKVGLIDSRGKSFFAGQIIFPYWSQGRATYFVGRSTEAMPAYKQGRKYDKMPKGDNAETISYSIFGEDSLRGQDRCVIAEGVTDCLSALDRGLPSITPITTSFSDREWDRVYRLTQGRHAIIVPDNEESGAGLRGAEKTRARLEAQGIEASILMLPRPPGQAKIDLCEFLRDHSLEEFEELVNEQCKRTRGPFDIEDLHEISVARYLENEPPTLRWTLQNSLLDGSVGSMVANGGFGKGFLMLSMGAGIATHKPIFDGVWLPGDKRKVLFVTTEDPEDIMHHRFFHTTRGVISTIDDGRQLAENFFLLVCRGRDVTLNKTQNGRIVGTDEFYQLLRLGARIQDLSIIMLDPLTRFYSDEENANSQGTGFVHLLELLTLETGASVLITHHVSKNFGVQKGEGSLLQEASRGASAITNACRWQLNMSYASDVEIRALGGNPADKENRWRYLVGRVTKKNAGPPEPVFWLHREDGGVLQRVEPEEPVSEEIRDSLILDRIQQTLYETREAPLAKKMLIRTFCQTWQVGRDRAEAVIAKAIMARKLVQKEIKKDGPGKPTIILTLPPCNPDTEEA
jgi:hypothetical protein